MVILHFSCKTFSHTGQAIETRRAKRVNQGLPRCSIALFKASSETNKKLAPDENYIGVNN
jgi:hypothetical protein